MSKKLSLNGTWELRGGSGDRGSVGRFPHFDSPERFMKADVPGSVHETLIKEKIIKEPTIGQNVLESRWVEEFVWGYRRTFNLSEDDIKNKKVRIVLQRLDLTAIIYINGREAGRHNNFYYPCRLDITDLVHAGENSIFVRIESGLISSADKPALPYYGAMYNDASKLTKRMWLRKPQCSFEWDWSPRLINVGISGDVYLEFGDVFVDETAVLSNVSDDYSSADIEVRVFTDNLSGQSKSFTCKTTVLDTGEVFENKSDLPAGKSKIACGIKIQNPKLWNPIGFGEQYRYNLKVELYDENNNLIHEEIIKHGVRKVVIDQSKHPVKGTYFILIINGNKVFAKGGNFVPADIVYSRITRKDYDILTDRAIEANCNAMRVWGGGMYESDDFYDLCDEKGLVVWQDFIGACSSHPSNNNEFFENYRSEIKYQIRRMSRYASAVIYSGNNEIEWQVWEPVGGDRFPDANLYHWILPRTLKEEDPYKYYQPSSPFSPDFEYPNADHTGDQHPWNIGFSDFDFFKYRTYECRFPNEGGLRGPNSLPAMMACLENGQEYMHSFSWQVHENSIDDWGEHNTADYMVKEWLNIDPKTVSVEKYVYLGGFIQGDGLSEYILNFRRRKFDCASAIFWMYNDCWPTTRSWTIVDYYRNRTPSFYPVKRAFNPLAVDIANEDNKLRVYGISDYTDDTNAVIEYGIFTLNGEYIQKKSQEVIVKANASQIIAEIDCDLWQKTGNTKCLPYAILYMDGKIVSTRRFINTKYYELELKTPNISVRFDTQNQKAYVKSDVFVLGASIDLDGKKVADNFFDLFPDVEKEFDIKEIDGIAINAINISEPVRLMEK